jgi:hypothetical protein
MPEKPALYLVGGHTQQALWRPLSENYRLAFLNSGAGNLARQTGIEGVLILEEYMTPAMLDQAKAEAMERAYSVFDGIVSGSLVMDPDIAMLNGKDSRWLPVMTYESTTATIARVMACAVCAEKEGAAGVFVHEDVTPDGRILCQWGNAEGVPTLHVPHANHYIANDTGDIHCSTVAQHIGAAGTYMEDWYKTAGAAGEFTILGAPQWDRLYVAENMPSREFARRALGLPQDKLILAYGGTWAQITALWGSPVDELERGWQLMLRACKALDAVLIVKMHPGEAGGREQYYEKAMKEAELHGVITRAHNEFVVRASDCLVTQGSSNLAVEAAILGTPTVEIYQCSTKYPDYGPKGTWGDGLEQLIGEAIAAGPLPEFARAMNFDNDGHAVERVVEWVKKLCPPQ